MLIHPHQRSIAVLQSGRIGRLSREPVLRADHHRTIALRQHLPAGHEHHIVTARDISPAVDPEDPGETSIGLLGLQHLHLHLPASRLNPDRPDRKFPPL